jgi:hypothetical protein
MTDSGAASPVNVWNKRRLLTMASYFSFKKMITGYFVKIVYMLGFLALTLGGIALAVWAGLGLQAGTLPQQTAINYIAIGVGAVLVGNLAWRMVCEFWLLLFNMQSLVASIERGVNADQHPAPQVVTLPEPKRESVRDTAPTAVVGRSASVLGLS